MIGICTFALTSCNEDDSSGCGVGDMKVCRCSPLKYGTQHCLPDGTWGECVCEGCLPGETRQCECPDGNTGEQVCDSSGDWGDCDCTMFWTSWLKTYGKVNGWSFSMAQLTDGGFMLVTGTPFDADTSADVRIFRLDEKGDIVWQKIFSSEEADYAFFIRQTAGDRFIVAGTVSPLLCECPDIVDSDIWIFEIDGDGNLLWQKRYKGSGEEWAWTITQLEDGGYAVAGNTQTLEEDSKEDIFVLRLDGEGNVVWMNTYGGEGRDDFVRFIYETPEGGTVLAAYTDSLIDGTGPGLGDILVLRLDRDGNILSQRTYGGSGGDWPNTFKPTRDNCFVLVGGTYSFGEGGGDMWVLKLDRFGDPLWQKTYGGPSEDYGVAVVETADNGFLVAGNTSSFGAGDVDAWLLRTDGHGSVMWEKTYGGEEYDGAYIYLFEAGESGWLSGGWTLSLGEESFSAWLMMTGDSGGISDACPAGYGADVSSIVGETSITPGATDFSPVVFDVTAVEALPGIDESEVSVKKQCGQ
ncbi:MAG: hypothetical protein ABIJ56_10335 [Pseudomonadota bacterium]